MDLIVTIIFLSLYYLRPQEWFSSFNALRPVQLLSALALFAMLQKGRFRIKELIATPVDFLVVLYMIWTIIAGRQPGHTLGQIEAVVLFYFVAACSMDTIAKQKKFLGWWCGWMIFIAALAIASMYGFDPLGSNDVTVNHMKGRLVLNLSVFDNPNSLAHSIISAVPLIYYLMFWRQVRAKPGLLLMAIPLYCLFLTASKGAFLCCFATMLATLTFGRSKIAQACIILCAVLFGYGALYMLPRMNELSKSKADPAIQGRVAAAKYGLGLMRATKTGVGLGNFQDRFFHDGPTEQLKSKEGFRTRIRNVHYAKAPHSAYNQNGAELGYPGLFLFVGILYCCIRTLVMSKTETDDEERIRRGLFALVVAYAASSWMVDFCYRPTFFLMVATVSAFHRHLLRKNDPQVDPAVEEAARLKPWMRRLPHLPGLALGVPAGASPAALAPVFAASSAAASSFPARPAKSIALLPPPAFATASGGALVLAEGPETGGERPDIQRMRRLGPDGRPQVTLQERLAKQFSWTRLGPLDFVLILALTYVVIRYWEHIIATM